MKMLTAQDVIQLLDLQPLPKEGGYFRRTYRSAEQMTSGALPARYQKAMAFGTAIYALFTPTDFSAIHCLPTDEVYHFYYGDPLEMLLLYPNGSGEIFILGNDLRNGMQPQKVVPRNVWQGSRLITGGTHGFSLIGTTMAPGFEWDGFELGNFDTLSRQYPHFTEQIEARIRF